MPTRPREPSNTRPNSTRNPTVGSTQNMGVCSVTPSNQAGSLDNIITRLERIEAVLSALLGGDVTANQLSDLSGSGGVITDLIATASNAAGGWITDGTFTGVGISTLGWGFYDSCTGEMGQWPIVTMENGVLNYGVSTSGCVEGTGSDSSGDTRFVVTMTSSAYTVRSSGGGIVIASSPNVKTSTIVAVGCPAGLYLIHGQVTFFSTFSKFLDITTPTGFTRGTEAICPTAPFGTAGTIHPHVQTVYYSSTPFSVSLEGGDVNGSSGQFEIVKLGS